MSRGAFQAESQEPEIVRCHSVSCFAFQRRLMASRRSRFSGSSKSTCKIFRKPNPEHGNKESKNRGTQHNQGPVWGGFPIRRHGSVHHLNDRALPRLVEFGDFEFLRQQLEDGLLVLEVAKPAEVFHAGLRHSSLGKIDV